MIKDFLELLYVKIYNLNYLSEQLTKSAYKIFPGIEVNIEYSDGVPHMLYWQVSSIFTVILEPGRL